VIKRQEEIKMNLNDVLIIEGEIESDPLSYGLAMQKALNAGAGWRMQGSFGRSMMDALKSGRAMLGKVGHYDYWQNYVPSRYEVKPGSFGSKEFVAEAFGQDYANQLSEVE
jgi:hypothetical protein